MSKDIVIVSAVRTPIGRFMGTLASFSAPQLGALVVKEAVSRAKINPEMIDEVIMGNVVGAGLGQNPARQAALNGGLPAKVAAMTINKVCGSGLKAVILAAQAILCGDIEIAIAGGLESMSNAPYILPNARYGFRMGHAQVLDLMISDGLWDVYHNYHMGITGENVAEKYKINQAEQDEYAYHSHRKAIAAIKAGRFKEQILPVQIPQKKGDPVIFDTDESPREDTTAEKLNKLKPAFKKDGTVTAGNAPGVNDGAAALVVMSAEKASKLGLKPLARILASATSGIEPEWVMLAPIKAVKMVLQKVNKTVDDIDLYELNEAFSVQAIQCVREIGCNPERVNINGGAVALGHPIGATGAIILTKLIYALKDQNKKLGVASLCLGGGNAVAMVIERI